MQSVVVGVSGGVDSVASVLLLKEQGYRVMGLYIDMLGDYSTGGEALRRVNFCDADRNGDLIEQISSSLEIDVAVLDAREEFRKGVIEPFIESYASGETPSPCAICNPTIKWAMLERAADLLGCGDALLATGHYCQKELVGGYYYICKGVDSVKNQSYYLWTLPQRILKRALFPLGRFLKSDVKRMVSERGLDNYAAKKESMGVCFLRGLSCEEFLLKERPSLALLSHGEIVDGEGRVLGEHRGYPFYTLAQKRGVLKGSSYCVVDIDPSLNRLIVGQREDLYVEQLVLRDLYIVNEEEFFSSSSLELNVRGIGENPSGFCSVKRADSFLEVKLNSDKAWAVASGQPAIFYIGDRLVGGGIVL